MSNINIQLINRLKRLRQDPSSLTEEIKTVCDKITNAESVDDLDLSVEELEELYAKVILIEYNGAAIRERHNKLKNTMKDLERVDPIMDIMEDDYV